MYGVPKGFDINEPDYVQFSVIVKIVKYQYVKKSSLQKSTPVKRWHTAKPF